MPWGPWVKIGRDFPQIPASWGRDGTKSLKNEARSYFFPNVDLSFSHSRTVSGRGIAEYQGVSFIRSAEKYWYTQAGLSVTQYFFTGGQNYFRFKTNDLQFRSARAAARNTRAGLYFEVEKKYWDAFLQRRMIEVREEAVNLSEEELSRAQELRSLGKSVDADVLKAKVELADTKTSLAQARRDCELAFMELFSLMGVEYIPPVVLDEPAAAATLLAETDAEVHFRESLLNRADLEEMSSLVEGAEYGVKTAKATRYPAIYGFFEFNWGSREIGDITAFYDENYNWHTGVGVTVPLFDGLYTKSCIERTRCEREKLKAQQKQLLLDIKTDIRSSLVSLQEAAGRMVLTDERIRYAREHLELITERYRLGKEPMLEVVSARVAFTEAKLAILTAERDYRLAWANLRRARGETAGGRISR